MYVEKEDVVKQPVEVVYRLVRDELSKLVPYIPNAEKIETVNYERTSETRVEILNHWFAKADVPSILKSFVKPEFFQWKDHAIWKDDQFCVDFRIESFVANNLYDLSGTNYFTSIGDDKTEIKLTFNFEIYPERLPGVPKFLGKRIKPAVEQLIKRMLTPNLTSLAKGLNEYFAANPPAKKPAAKKASGKKSATGKASAKKPAAKKQPAKKKKSTSKK